LKVVTNVSEKCIASIFRVEVNQDGDVGLLYMRTDNGNGKF
jgi:hypothetical protein